MVKNKSEQIENRWPERDKNTMYFQKDFIKELRLNMPEKIQKIDLIYPEKQLGYIRFDDDVLNAIYLSDIRDKYDNEVLIKLKYRDFHYRDPSFIFNGLYLNTDGANETRFDKDLNITAKYLTAPAMRPNLSEDKKFHILGILNEWWKITNKWREENEDHWITAYQIEKNGINVKVPYIWNNEENKQKKINNPKHLKKLCEIINEFDLEKCYYASKGSINDKYEVKRDNVIYLMLDSHAKFVETLLTKSTNLKL